MRRSTLRHRVQAVDRESGARGGGEHVVENTRMVRCHERYRAVPHTPRGRDRTTPTPRARHKRRRGAVEDGVTYNFKYSFPSAPTGGPSRQCPRGRGDTWRGDPSTAVGGDSFLCGSYARNATFCTGRNRYDGGTKHSDHRSHRYDNSYNAAAIDVHRAALSIGRLCAGFHRAQDVLHNGTRPEEVEGKARVAAGYNAV